MQNIIAGVIIDTKNNCKYDTPIKDTHIIDYITSLVQFTSAMLLEVVLDNRNRSKEITSVPFTKYLGNPPTKI